MSRMDEATIEIAERPQSAPTLFDVAVTDAGGTSRHAVCFDDWAERKAAAIGCSADMLVEAAFRFLLEREPKEAILREFALSVIARYFPAVDQAIAGYLPARKGR